MRSPLALVSGLFLLFCSLSGRGQYSDMYNAYGINDGLSQSSVWSIVQDKNGFMWFGTADGLCRFDGYTFTTYKNDPADPTSILDATNNGLYVDSDGQLWTVSLKGICLYDYKTDKFKTVFSSEQKRRYYYYNNCIFGEYDGYIWASMPIYGLVKVDKRTQKVSIVKHAARGERGEIIPNTEQKGLLNSGFIDKGKIWISLGTDHFIVYDIKNDKLDKPRLPTAYSFANLNDSEVVASTDKGLLVMDKATYRYREIPLDIEVRGKQITVEGGQLVIASFIGIVYIDIRTWNVTRVVNSFERKKSTSYDNIHCLYRDRSDNLWIGTNGDGIKMQRAPYKKFGFYSSYSVSNLVKAIYADKDNLYVGYFKNDLDIFDRRTGEVVHKTIRLDTFQYGHIFSLAALGDGHFLLRKGDVNFAYIWSLTSGKATSLYPVISKVLPRKDAFIGEPFHYKRGDTVTVNIGSDLVDLDVSDPQNIKAKLGRSFGTDIPTSQFIDDKGTKWVGTINGIYYEEAGDMKLVDLHDVAQVKSINQDLNGNIWVATLKGIFIIGRDKKLSKRFTETTGLTNGFIYGILRDNNGNMWFSHNKGLSMYNVRTKRFRHYTSDDGLQSNEFNTGAFFKADDGTLFFGGINGTNGFLPADIKDNPNEPVTVITSIQVFEAPLRTDVAYWNVQEIELPYDRNSLSFEFAALEYTNPARNRYAYIMDGLDEKWINSGDRRFARYPSLPPGNYTFKVKAANNDGIWQDVPTEIKITIVPPFWQTWWFQLLCFVLAAAILVALVLGLQEQRNRRQMRALELQQKIQMERERISRDLHDNVGTQLSLISNNIAWVEHPLKPMTEQEKQDKLQQVNQMARDIIHTLRETIWALKKEQIALEEFSDKLKAFAQKQLALYPEIELGFEEQLNDQLVLGPSEALDLFRICQEAIANALKYSNCNRITIAVVSIGGQYKVSVADNGQGFDTGATNSSGNGLDNMKYRSADIGAELFIESIPGGGTTVTITKNSADAV